MESTLKRPDIVPENIKELVIVKQTIPQATAGASQACKCTSMRCSFSLALLRLITKYNENFQVHFKCATPLPAELPQAYKLRWKLQQLFRNKNNN